MQTRLSRFYFPISHPSSVQWKRVHIQWLLLPLRNGEDRLAHCQGQLRILGLPSCVHWDQWWAGFPGIRRHRSVPGQKLLARDRTECKWYPGLDGRLRDNLWKIRRYGWRRRVFSDETCVFFWMAWSRLQR